MSIRRSPRNSRTHAGALLLATIGLSAVAGIRAHAGGPVSQTPAEHEIRGEAAANAGRLTFSDFAGTWERHGLVLLIGTDGSAAASWRTYRWCDEPGEGPCDEIRDGQIQPGGTATGTFHRISGTTAFGVFTASNLPERLPPGPVQLMLLPFGMARLTDATGGSEHLCSAHFGEVAPAELLETLPCGL